MTIKVSGLITNVITDTRAWTAAEVRAHYEKGIVMTPEEAHAAAVEEADPLIRLPNGGYIRRSFILAIEIRRPASAFYGKTLPGVVLARRDGVHVCIDMPGLDEAQELADALASGDVRAMMAVRPKVE